MICENCGKEHDGSFGSGRFCNRKCANSRIISDEMKEKVSKKLKGRIICPESLFKKGHSINKGKKRKNRILSIEFILKNYKNKKLNPAAKSFIKNSKLQNCEICGISNIWNNKELILQLHHIDGNPLNNVENNWQLLCPNCHTQTDNFVNRKR